MELRGYVILVEGTDQLVDNKKKVYQSLEEAEDALFAERINTDVKCKILSLQAYEDLRRKKRG